MLNNILKIYIDNNGNIIKTSNLSINQYSRNNIIQLVTVGFFSNIKATFALTDKKVSDAYHMTCSGKYELNEEEDIDKILVDNQDNLYKYELLIPYRVTSASVTGSIGRMNVSFGCYTEDKNNFILNASVANVTISVNRSDQASTLDASYSADDVENLWNAAGKLENEKVNRSGDTITGNLVVEGTINGHTLGTIVDSDKLEGSIDNSENIPDSSQVKTYVDAETTRATTAEGLLDGRVTILENTSQELAANKVDKTHEPNKIYGTDNNGNQVIYPRSDFEGAIKDIYLNGESIVSPVDRYARFTTDDVVNEEHKISSDNVDDSSATNKFVTEEDLSNITANTNARHTHSNKSLLDTYNQTNSDLTDAVDKKHSHSNKSLLDTYDQTNENIVDAVDKKHTHSNKELLDTYDQTNSDITAAITDKHTHPNKSLLDTYTQTDNDLYSAVNLKHSHANKELLDTYTQTEENLADAVDKKHSHSNKSVLDTITSELVSQISTNANDIDTIEAKIPDQATSSNQLADKNFVNSSIATNTATFRGTYDIVTDLGLTTSATESEISAALNTAVVTKTNNDYTFVAYPSTHSTGAYDKFDRYKYDATNTEWNYEYTLNNSSFTADQWDAINSGITSTLVGQITTNQTDITNIKDGASLDSFGDVETELGNYVKLAGTQTITGVKTFASGADPIITCGTAGGFIKAKSSFFSSGRNLIGMSLLGVCNINTSNTNNTGNAIGGGDFYPTSSLSGVASLGRITSDSNYVWKDICFNGALKSISNADYGLKMPLTVDWTANRTIATTTDVSAKQNIINSNNKLSSDYVDDTNHTNKFVTASEKSQITTNANNITTINNSAVMTSGITSSKVTQITTNQNDISAIKDGTTIDSFGDVETTLGNYVDKASAQTITGIKSFDDTINIKTGKYLKAKANALLSYNLIGYDGGVKLGANSSTSISATCNSFRPGNAGATLGASTSLWDGLYLDGGIFSENNATYGLLLPDTTAWTANKTIATTDLIPAAQVQANWTESDTAAASYIQNKPSLATVATSGDYDDLLNKPTIPAAQIQSDWDQTDNTALDYIKNKPTIPSAITSINGLSGGTLTSPLNISGGDATTAAKIALDQTTSGQITNNSTQTLFGFTSNNATNLTVGHSSYGLKLRGSGTRPQFNSNDLALYSDIPTVPTVNDATLTIQQNGNNVQTFTANSSTNKTANIITVNPNLLINPDFRIDQKKAGYTAYTANEKYTVDRWKIAGSSSGISVYAPNSNNNYRLRITSTVTTGVFVKQVIEMPKYLRNKDVTFSIKCDSVDNISLYIVGITTSGATSYQQLAAQDFSGSATTASITASIGNTFYDYLDLRIKVRASTTKYIEYAKLEVGSVATTFSPPDYAEEILKCQRYYCEMNPDRSWWRRFGNGYAESSTSALYIVNFPVQMRAEPSVTFSGTVYDLTSGATLSKGNNTSTTPQCAYIHATGSGMTAWRPSMICANGAVGNIIFDAELSL